MSAPLRETHTNTQGYQEVTSAYRSQRSLLLEAQQIGSATHIVCPMVDASRRTNAYGKNALPGLKSKDLTRWSNALGLPPAALKTIAYASGKVANIPKNILTGSFDDEAINGGFIHALKNGIHTGIYQDGRFDEASFNAFVWAFHPELEGTALTREWLYSEQGATLYLETAHLPIVIAYNKSERPKKKVGLGERFSTFEMKDLLLKVVGQTITKDGKTTQAILIRDIHDLYKYGFLTVPIEENMVAADLLEL